MMKKVLMIAVMGFLGFQSKALLFTPTELTRMPASELQSALVQPEEGRKTQSIKQMQNICMIHAGDVGKLKFKGKTYEQAFSRVTDECFQKRTQTFVQNRKMHPDQDRQIQFAESCVNAVKCI